MIRTIPILFLLATFAASLAASAATTVLNRISDGHVMLRQDGTAITSDTTNIVGEGLNSEYRTFLTFSLSAVTEPVVALTLRLKIDAYNNGATSSSFAIYDYIDTPPSVIGGGRRTDQFDDLGSGVLYGSASITAATNPAGSFLEIALNSDAIAALNSGSGVYTWADGSRSFMLGIADLQVSGNDYFNVRFAHGSGARINQLVVQTIPEPSAFVLFAAAFSFIGGYVRFR